MFFCRLVRSPMLVIARVARAAAALTVLLGTPAVLGAQQAFVPQRSTVDGVFTAAQATRGADVYNMLCQSCHSAESHTGTPFRNNWVGKPLAELFGYISSEMPKTEPGSLTPEEYTLVLAYILKMNGMPAGRRALTADAAQLDSIRIDLPKRATLGTTRDR
jgi:mono/diheme cytochrome c family protein